MPKGKISQDKNLAEKISRQIEMDRKAEGSEMRKLTGVSSVAKVVKTSSADILSTSASILSFSL
jgi:hypothetical protein